MCLIAIAWRAHPDYPLVIAANRDEDRERPTSQAGWWPDLTDLLAGRDLQAGGTWLGVTRSGRFAALTNFRGPRKRPDTPSRGALVVNALETGRAVMPELDSLALECGRYNPFSLLCYDGRDLGILESASLRSRLLKPGIYGLSNQFLDTPWPKIQRAKAAFADAIDASSDDSRLFAVLKDNQLAADEELPDTGIGKDWERQLSSIYISGENYGTRSSTVIRYRRDGTVILRELSWGSDDCVAGDVRFEFRTE